MTRSGHYYNKAVVESFFAILKIDSVYHERYATRTEAQRSIFKYIEMFYNRIRIHSSLGGISPEFYGHQMPNLV